MTSIRHDFDWCVVGNGANTFGPLPIAKHTIGFNKPIVPPFDVIVHNNAHQGLSKTISLKINSIFDVDLLFFKHTAYELEKTLGCWPSLGLVAIATAIKCKKSLSVRYMNLLPSLARPTSFPVNKPLAASYHNWLAERRYAFTLLREIDWPEYRLISNHVRAAISKPVRNWLIELASIQTLGKGKAKQRIDELFELSIMQWYAAVSVTKPQDIAACDSVFILSRTNHQTPNWWLYDIDYSLKMDAIRTKLAHAEEWHLFALS